MLLDQLVSLYESELKLLNRSPCTIRCNARWVRVFGRQLAAQRKTTYEKLQIESITGEDARQYIAALQSQDRKWEGKNSERAGSLSPFTVNQAARLLRGFGNWLEHNEFANPFKKLPIPKTPINEIEILTEDEIKRLLASVDPNTAHGARVYAIVLIMLGSGLRLGEVASLQTNNLDLDHRKVRVLGKGNKWRTVSVGVRTTKALIKYLHVYRTAPANEQAQTTLFLSVDGYALGNSGVHQIIRRLRKRSHIPRLHAHLFRHTFAVRYLLQGGDIASLQEILGHDDITTTRMYLHLTKDQIVAQHRKFDPIDAIELEPRRFSKRRESR